MPIDLKKQVDEILTEQLKDDKVFVVDVISAEGKPARKVQVLLDGDEGVDIEKCAEISRKLAARLDEIDPEDTSPYVLEVSSAGVDYPLKFHRQYIKNIGRQVKVQLVGNEQKKGKLLRVNEKSFVIEEQIKEKGKKAQLVEIEISFENTKKTNVLVSFT